MAPPGPRSATPVNGTSAVGAEDLGPVGATPARTSSSASAYATDGGVASEAFIDDVAVTVDGATAHRRRRGRRRRVDRRGVHASSAARPRAPCRTLPRREPGLQRLRRHPADRAVQLRLGQHQARLGGAVPVPERHARLVRQRRVRRQQHLAHPGGGQVLPVDARPAPVRFPDGDAAGQPSPAVRRDLRPGGHRRGDLPPQRRADDRAVAAPASRRSTTRTSNRYWTSANPWASTKVAGTGTSLTVAKTDGRWQPAAGEGPLPLT